jgi:hypothetical protein
MVKIIEAEYQVQTTQFWEPKHIEGWPTDEKGGPRDINSAFHFYIKWGRLNVTWDEDGGSDEYEPTHVEDPDVFDFKWPDAEYVDGERID